MLKFSSAYSERKRRAKLKEMTLRELSIGVRKRFSVKKFSDKIDDKTPLKLISSPSNMFSLTIKLISRRKINVESQRIFSLLLLFQLFQCVVFFLASHQTIMKRVFLALFS